MRGAFVVSLTGASRRSVPFVPNGRITAARGNLTGIPAFAAER